MPTNHEETKKEIQKQFEAINEVTKRSLFDKFILCVATIGALSSAETTINEPNNRTEALCSLVSNLSLIYLIAQRQKSQKQKFETATLGVHFDCRKDFNLSHALARNQQTLQKVNLIKWGGAVAVPALSFMTGNLNFLPAYAAMMSGISATIVYRNKLLNDQRKIVEAGVPKNIIPNTKSREN